MTARELIKRLQDLGEEGLDKEIIMLDCSSYYTPYRIQIIDEKLGFKNERLIGNILIDWYEEERVWKTERTSSWRRL